MPMPPDRSGPSSPVAAILLKLKHGDKGGDGGGPGDDLEMAAQEFIAAVKSGDAKALANIFRSMTDIASVPQGDDEMAEGEGDDMPPEFPGGGGPPPPEKE